MKNKQHFPWSTLYKYIINKSIVDNLHTTEQLKDRLEGLLEFMVACDSDLTKFHLQFNEVKGLLTSG